MQLVWQDLRFACRSLMKSPALILTIVLSLAFAIGINTAVFSVLNEVLFNPFPFKNPGRIVFFNENYHMVNYETVNALSEAFKKGPFFEEIAGSRFHAFWITTETTPFKVVGLRVSGDPLHLMGVQPVIGRFFRKDEDKFGAPVVAMLSYDCWRKRFAGDPNVIGKNIRIDGMTATLVGVVPKIPNWNEEIWLPMSALHDHKLKRFRMVFLMGRLRSERSIRQAQDWVNSIARELGASQDHQFELQTIRDANNEVEKESIPILWIWMGASALIFLITIANVVSMLLARSSSREKEFAIRASLGANHFELVRLQIIESLLLCIVGGIAGFFIALWFKDLISGASQPPELWFRNVVKISNNMNWTVFLFTGVISLIAGITSGIVPAIQLAKRNFHSSMKATSPDLPRRRSGNLLVVMELSLAVILMTGAGLLIKGLLLLTNVDPGFQTRNIVKVDMQLPSYKYSEPAQSQAFHEGLLIRLRTIPGVELASAVLWPPSTGSSWGEVALDDSPEQWEKTGYQVVAPDYFQLMGIGLSQGRYLGEEDRANSPLVAVVSERFAKHFFPQQNPLGKRLSFDDGELSEGPKQIVGVVRDVHQSGLGEAKDPLIYVPFAQSSILWRQILLRTKIPHGTLSEFIRQQVREMDPDQPVGQIETMDQVVSNSFADRRLRTLLLSALGITGLLISMIGVYGLISYSVSRRTHEMGIRMAIGAQKWDIFKMVTRQGIVLTIVGLAIGVGGSMALSRFLSSIIYGINPGDPQIFVAVCFLFLLAAILASYFPAQRASKVDPIIALKDE